MKKVGLFLSLVSCTIVLPNSASERDLPSPVHVNIQNVRPYEDYAEQKRSTTFQFFRAPNSTAVDTRILKNVGGELRNAFANNQPQWSNGKKNREIWDGVTEECKRMQGLDDRVAKNGITGTACWLKNGVRDDSWKTSARACMRKNPNSTRVFAVHIRKAGGTTLRSWLGSLMCKNKFNGYVQEGRIMDITRLSARGTFFVTILRDPVERIWSSYLYEGISLKAPKVREKYGHKPLTFAQYFEEVRLERSVGSAYRIWHEVENYYIQVFSGIRYRGVGTAWNDPNSTAIVTEKTKNKVDWDPFYARAAAVLRAFDVVLITEWLSSGEMTAWATRKLGLPVAPGTNKQLSSAHNKNRVKMRYLGVTHEHPNEWEKAQLYDINALDFLFYNMAKNLTRDAIARDTDLTSPPIDTSKSTCVEEWDGIAWGESLSRMASRLCSRSYRLNCQRSKEEDNNPYYSRICGWE